MEFGGALTSPDPSYYREEKMIHQPNVKERLEMAVKQAEDRLAAVKRAKEIFEKYPA